MHIYICISVAFFAQDWFASRSDYVQLGHVVPIRLLSLVAIVAIFVGLYFVFGLPILCARAWVLYSCKLGPIIDNCRAHCHYGHLNCLAHYRWRYQFCLAHCLYGHLNCQGISIGFDYVILSIGPIAPWDTG